MNNVVKIETKLCIVIITYNRATLLSETLLALKDSPFKHCTIKVLNNSSSDNTLEICHNYINIYSDLQVITNRFNIGGDANILRAIEIADKEYVWILADDDKYNFQECQDVIDCIVCNRANLIHVGAHTDVKWEYGGRIDSIQQLVKEGYTFFRFSSFIPCNIFKVNDFLPYVIDGYKNIPNLYAHMPYLLSCYRDNKLIYISRNRIVKAVIGHQNYTSKDFFKGWINTSYLLPKEEDKRLCFFEQFANVSPVRVALACYLMYLQSQMSRESFRKIFSLLKGMERVGFVVLIFPYLIGKRIKQRTLGITRT